MSNKNHPVYPAKVGGAKRLVKYDVIFCSGKRRIYETDGDLLETFSNSIKNSSTHIGFRLPDGKLKFIIRTDSVASVHIIQEVK